MPVLMVALSVGAVFDVTPLSVQALVNGLTCKAPALVTVLTQKISVALATSAATVVLGNSDKSKRNKALALLLILRLALVPKLLVGAGELI
jgi:hypothetical protein